MDKGRLIKKVITNKKGIQQTVYVVPVTINPEKQVGKDKYAPTKMEHIIKNTGKTVVGQVHSPNVSGDVKIKKRIAKDKSGNVVNRPNVKTVDFSKKYGEKSMTFKIMNGGVKYVDGRPQMNEKEWQKLLKEHDGFILKTASHYNYGEYYGDKFNELKQVGRVGFLEGVNNYGKVQNPEKKFDFNSFVYNYVTGRIKDSVSKEFRSGIQIPKHLILGFQQYKQVQDKIFKETGKVPDTTEVARELQKVWTKKTFLPDYQLAEEKTYSVANDKKLTDKDAEIVDSKTFDDTKKKYTFHQLPEVWQKQFKQDDDLPMSGYATVYKRGVLQTKQETHTQNVEKINKRFLELEDRLKETYDESQITEPEEFEQRKKLLTGITKELAKKEIEYKDAFNDYKDKRMKYVEDYKRYDKMVDDLDIKLKTTTDKSKLETYQKQHTILSKKIGDMVGAQQQEKTFSPLLEKIDNTKKDVEKLKQNLEIAKKVYSVEPMSVEDFEKEKSRLNLMKTEAMDTEKKRYGRDASSSLVPGVLDRVKEFENIQALRELRLDINIDAGKDGGEDSVSPLETVFIPQLTPEEEQMVREEHKRGKKTLVRGIDEYLIGNLANTLKLHLGLHNDSEKSEGDIWGKLKSNKEIKDWFVQNKIKTNEQVGSQLQKVMESGAGGMVNIDAFRYVNDIPFLTKTYENNPNRIYTDYKNWQSSNPAMKKSEAQKVKLTAKEYKKVLFDWKNNKQKAKDDFEKWKKDNKKTGLAKQKEQYNTIKTKWGVLDKNEPPRFKMVEKEIKPTKALIEKWQNSIPKFVEQSESKRENWVSRKLDVSRDLIKNIIPLKSIRQLLQAHRKMVEHGLVEKSLFNSFEVIYDFIKDELYFNKVI